MEQCEILTSAHTSMLVQQFVAIYQVMKVTVKTSLHICLTCVKQLKYCSSKTYVDVLPYNNNNENQN